MLLLLQSTVRHGSAHKQNKESNVASTPTWSTQCDYDYNLRTTLVIIFSEMKARPPMLGRAIAQGPIEFMFLDPAPTLEAPGLAIALFLLFLFSE